MLQLLLYPGPSSHFRIPRSSGVSMSYMYASYCPISICPSKPANASRPWHLYKPVPRGLLYEHVSVVGVRLKELTIVSLDWHSVG